MKEDVTPFKKTIYEHQSVNNSINIPNSSSYSSNISTIQPEQNSIRFSESTFSVKTYNEAASMPSIHQTSENEDAFPPLGFAKAQMHETYIVSQTKDSIIITDQHAAHERLTYEKLIKNNESLQAQLLLIPEIVDLTEDEVEILLSRSNELKAFGFVIESFGGNSVVVREMPALFNKTNIPKLIEDLAQTIKEYDDTILLKDKLKDICARMACHGSVRAGRTLTINEMNALLRQMEECSTSGQCIHGRPTYIELKLPDVERLFGRSK
jgi:DNA mismatch repair protein MutL